VTPHLLCIGGNDHGLRVPFLLALRDRGFRVSAAGTGDSAPFVHAGIDYYRFHYDRSFNIWTDIAAFNALSKLISELRPDLVQSFDTKPNWLAPLAARRAGIPSVRTINGLALVYSSRSLRARLFRPVWRGMHRLVAQSTAKSVFQNRDDEEFFRRHNLIGKAGSRLIPGSGVDVERFRSDAVAGHSKQDLRHKLGLAASEVVITVSRMTREKGIPTLLNAAALVHAERPGVRFLLVGPRNSEGAAAVSQAEISRHAPYVVYLGQRSDIARLLSLADVFAFPTEYREGVPRVLLEAAAAGLPIVTTNMPGCRDVVRHGLTGFIVPTAEPQIVANCLLGLLNNKEEARAMGARAMTFIQENFSLSLIVDKYAALYHEVMARSVDTLLIADRRHGQGPVWEDLSVSTDPATATRQAKNIHDIREPRRAQEILR
jgi:glycosyltransferase involved in cell wall biosynthesis